MYVKPAAVKFDRVVTTRVAAAEVLKAEQTLEGLASSGYNILHPSTGLKAVIIAVGQLAIDCIASVCVLTLKMGALLQTAASSSLFGVSSALQVSLHLCVS